VYFEFNGTLVLARPGETANVVATRYSNEAHLRRVAIRDNKREIVIAATIKRLSFSCNQDEEKIRWILIDLVEECPKANEGDA